MKQPTTSGVVEVTASVFATIMCAAILVTSLLMILATGASIVMAFTK